ncbi:killer cell lectin-like receptor subfamily B member 1B allele C isoform X2 [Chrysemys picta bellii]|uniref:killer cell lectin-like receptor subfamily B member 1B allele C isoform X2 n=1 Tax=Chrysemys picta bellii TaxID=8478 RepID=UPI0032B23CA6
MAGEIVYADLNLSPGFPGSRAPLSAQPHSPTCPWWHRTALGVGWIGNIVLVIAVIALGIWGGSGCKLCPTDWRLRRDKCYWVVRGSKTWSESRADCSARGSQLLVIRDPKELEFIKDLTQDSKPFWIGLSVPSPEKAWTWVDGSRLDQSLFQEPGPAEGNSCGAVAGNQINSETCSSAFQWICQRDAILL